MSDNPQIRAILEYVEAREAELGEQAGGIRSRIEEPTTRLGELDAESENLRITRKTLLSTPAPEPPTNRRCPTCQTTRPTSRSSPPSLLQRPRCGPAISARPSAYLSSRRTPKAVDLLGCQVV